MFLGIDIGSTTAKIAVLDGSGSLVHSRCQRHRGHPATVAHELVDAAREAASIVATGMTGSMGVGVADEFDAVAVHEVQAVAAAVRELNPATRTVVELGGQDAKILFLAADPNSDDAQMNDRCAAGTGATIDRIAYRLGIKPGELGALSLSGDLRVASRCGVFSELDAVNLLKQGATRDDALSALARAIVVQNLSVLARGRTLRPPVLLLGGPHAHVPALAEAWQESLQTLWRDRSVQPGLVTVPKNAALFAAIGAALHASRRGRSLALVTQPLHRRSTLGPLIEPAGGSAEIDTTIAPCSTGPLAPGTTAVHVGIDAGSTTAKAVLLDVDGRVVAATYGPSSANPVDDVRDRLSDLHRSATAKGATLEVRSVAVTGYGAELVAAAFGADATVVETLAHARAAVHHAPGTDVVVDVGGTDVKVIQLDGDRVDDFFVSNQCAAGLGAFLAAAAADLGVSIEAFAARALSASRAPAFTVGCAVFMDTDRVTFQRDGFCTDELLAGLAWSVPRSVWEFVVPVPPERLGRRFLLTGGTHKNLAATQAQVRYLSERVPGAEVRVHPHPEAGGAIGAALHGMQLGIKRGATAFAGWAEAENVRCEMGSGQALRCQRCEIECARTAGLIDRPGRSPERLLLGNTCERGADLGATGARSDAHAPDLLDEEAARLFRKLLATPSLGPPSKTPPVIAIPRVMSLYRCAPLILHYLRAAGVRDENVLLSPTTSNQLFVDGARWGVNDPCFPAKLVLAHVDWLLRQAAHRPIDYLFMPTITHAAIAVTGTVDTASCPVVAACGHTSIASIQRDQDTLGRLGIQPLLPDLSLIDRDRLEAQLFGAFGPVLGIDAATNRSALEHGLAAQSRFHDRCRRRGARVLSDAERRGRAVAVVLARPYHADPGVQHGVSVELAARGVPVMGISSLPLGDRDELDLSSVLPLATNSGCAEKVWAVKRIASDRHLVAVDLSSFRCGQDASVLGLVSDLLGATKRPVLRLHELDENRPSASIRVRVETFVETVRRYEREVLAR